MARVCKAPNRFLLTPSKKVTRTATPIPTIKLKRSSSSVSTAAQRYEKWLEGRSHDRPSLQERLRFLFPNEIREYRPVTVTGPAVTIAEATGVVVSIELVDEDGNTHPRSIETVKQSKPEKKQDPDIRYEATSDGDSSGEELSDEEVSEVEDEPGVFYEEDGKLEFADESPEPGDDEGQDPDYGKSKPKGKKRTGRVGQRRRR